MVWRKWVVHDAVIPLQTIGECCMRTPKYNTAYAVNEYALNYTEYSAIISASYLSIHICDGICFYIPTTASSLLSLRTHTYDGIHIIISKMT